jgi:hypothetical protein
MIVYDRACKLHTYFLKREPRFVHDTVFRVDILHYANHTGCSEGYNPRVYRQPGVRSSNDNSPWINTQIAEQTYSTLSALRTACAFTTQQHGQELVRFFLASRNERVKDSMTNSDNNTGPAAMET